ncbi:cyclin-like protein [Syncephalis plumigaleata]|nr:cyclin-like protein [Syncephalis plumigaleata]
MAASYWSSSQYQRWLIPTTAKLPGYERDLTYITWPERMKLTLHYTNLIQNIGKRMMLRQRVLATAMTYFQRFYANNAYRDTDAYPIACTCLYLAAKVEETPHHLRTFVNEMREYLKHASMNNEGDVKAAAAARFAYSSADIAELEIYLLEEMDFYMVLYHPYDLLTRLCDELQVPKSVLQTAWFVINDSFRIDVCLRYPPHVITLAALYMTCTLQPDDINNMMSNSSLTTDTSTTSTASLSDRLKQWFAGISTPLDKVAEVTQQLVNLYNVWDTYNDTDIPVILERLRVTSPSLKPTINLTDSDIDMKDI